MGGCFRKQMKLWEAIELLPPEAGSVGIEDAVDDSPPALLTEVEEEGKGTVAVKKKVDRLDYGRWDKIVLDDSDEDGEVEAVGGKQTSQSREDVERQMKELLKVKEGL